MKDADLVAGTNDIGFVTDRAGVIQDWNQAAEEAFDTASADAIGTTCWELLAGKDAFGNDYCGPACSLRRMALEGRRVHRCQLFFSDAAGTRRPYSVMTLLLRGGQPSASAVLHFLHPAVWDRRSTAATEPGVRGNHQRGELTRREMEVLALLADGQGTAAMAQTLRISRATTSNHIQRVLYKLNVHSRLEAVLLAKKLELV